MNMRNINNHGNLDIKKYQKDFPSISDAMLHYSRELPDRVCAYFRTNDDEEFVYTYSDIIKRSTALAYALKEKGLEQGDRVVVVLPTCPEFIFCFFGILLAGGIVVQAAPPLGFRDLKHYVDRLSHMIEDCGARFFISRHADFPSFEKEFPEYEGECAFLDISDFDFNRERTISYVPPSPDDICFIQYTSGSTGTPKGVPISHENIKSNLESIGAGLESEHDDICISWLPLYHDMGLIGGMLTPLYHNFPIIFFPPEAFIYQPIRWFRYITEYKASICLGNNFSYNYCLKKIKDKDLEGIDLSSLRTAFNGSEPINPQVLKKFHERFAKAGYAESAMFPCYGLAEATLAVTFAALWEPPKVLRLNRDSLHNGDRVVLAREDDEYAMEIVSVGKALHDMDVKICDSNNEPKKESTIGEIYIKGSAVMKGYYNQNKNNTGDTFHQGWLKTGDLGFIHNEELYITGRMKELIIIRGSNYYPADIEHVVKQVEGVDREAAAFSYIDPGTGSENLALVFESKTNDQDRLKTIQKKIRQEVLDHFGILPHKVIPASPGDIPKTANGKLRRNHCKDLFIV
ncbi:MAG: fatty acyl-AMP ligase [bacterium]|nr:fatty acyl-AMP ligase [bacterium]